MRFLLAILLFAGCYGESSSSVTPDGRSGHRRHAVDDDIDYDEGCIEDGSDAGPDASADASAGDSDTDTDSDSDSDSDSDVDSDSDGDDGGDDYYYYDGPCG